MTMPYAPPELPPEDEESTAPIGQETDRNNSVEIPEGEALVLALQTGSETAWDHVLWLYSSDLRTDIGHSLRKWNIPPEWVDDIEQDTWITAVQKIGDFKWQGEDKLYHWLRTIASQHVRTLHRKLKETGPSFDEMNENLDNDLALDLFCYANGVFADSPEIDIALKDTMKAVETAMQRLKPQAREMLVRRLIWRETPAKMAVEYGIPAEKISGILFRAKELIRVQLTAMDHLQDRGR